MAVFKRRRLVVDGNLQYSFMAVSISHFVLTVLVLGTTLFLPLVINLYDTRMSIAEMGLVAQKILYLNKMFWPAVVFLIVLICAHTIYQTHKIAGPLYRFRHAMRDVAGGELSGNFKLRKGDYLYTEMAILNELIEGLRSSVFEMKADQEKVADELNKALEGAGPNPPDELAEPLRAAMDRNRLLAERLNYFRTEPEPGPDSPG